MVAESTLYLYTPQNMYHPTTRVLAVLDLLQTHGRLTGADLAHRLEVDIRTLRRYITMLQDLGIPIVAERGRNGAYELGSGFKLPPMMFTNEEALALSLGLLAARHFGLSEAASAVESARAKIERVMPIELKGRVRALSETITLDLSNLDVSPPSEVMLTMSSAAQRRRRVHLHYRSGLGDETERDFDPYGVAFYESRWYAVGHCHLRNDLRSFRLDRVLQIDLQETRFERPKQFDSLAHVIQALATLPRQYSFAILLKTDLTTAQSETRDAIGWLEPHPEGILLRGWADDLTWMAKRLSKFPFKFKILEPESLRAALRQWAADLASMTVE
jgi:predicted DNA-binding transcriptional regulator YafY